jgi:methylthioribulose-1-phosphate dehydratase
VAIEGYEMLKGLEGVRTHQHREWLPILENSQDMADLARSVERILLQHPDCHGILLRKHGVYTWGKDLVQAKRHVEILEFLLEVVGREQRLAPGRVET